MENNNPESGIVCPNVRCRKGKVLDEDCIDCHGIGKIFVPGDFLTSYEADILIKVGKRIMGFPYSFILGD